MDAIKHSLVDPGVNAKPVGNSLIVEGGAVLMTLPFTVPAAYALSRFPVRFKKNTRLSGTCLSMFLVLQTLTLSFSI